MKADKSTRVIVCRGKIDNIRKSALLLLREKGFTYPTELSREAGCSWYFANKTLKKLGLKVYHLGCIKLFME